MLVVRSKRYNYVAVAYAGTDDYKTALTDGDILTSELGPTVNSSTDEGKNDLRSIFDKHVPKDVRVHRGFNSNVFDSEDYRKVLNCISSARLGGDCEGSSSTSTTDTSNILSDYSTKTDPSSITPYEIFTTGHSLGAANSVLLGVALHLYYPNETIRSVNFGCPKIGNVEWGMYMNSLQPEGDSIALERTKKEEKIFKGSFEVFRFVNKIDLVPRLPELPLLIHVGHTLQMSIGGLIRVGSCYFFASFLLEYWLANTLTHLLFFLLYENQNRHTTITQEAKHSGMQEYHLVGRQLLGHFYPERWTVTLANITWPILTSINPTVQIQQ